MAEKAKNIIRWLNTLEPDTQVGISEGGLSLEAITRRSPYFEVGMSVLAEELTCEIYDDGALLYSRALDEELKPCVVPAKKDSWDLNEIEDTWHEFETRDGRRLDAHFFRDAISEELEVYVYNVKDGKTDTSSLFLVSEEVTRKEGQTTEEKLNPKLPAGTYKVTVTRDCPSTKDLVINVEEPCTRKKLESMARINAANAEFGTGPEAYYQVEAVAREVTPQLTLRIEPDGDARPPWEDVDNDPVIIGVLSRYTIGPEDWSGQVHSVEVGLKKIKYTYGNAIVREIYAYIHSGIHLQLDSPEGLPDQRWDVSFAGWAVYPYELIRKNYGVKSVSKKAKERANGELENIIRITNQYLSGDVYGYVIEDGEGETVDSCWGFYGEEYCRQQGEDVLEHLQETEKNYEIV